MAAGQKVLDPQMTCGPMSTTNAWTTPSTNPWNRSSPNNAWNMSPPDATNSPPCQSLASVMDEEYAKELQQKEESHGIQVAVARDVEELSIPADLAPTSGLSETETTSDLLMAQMLQLEFDREHDAMLALEEKKVNRNSKVSISFANYRAVHPSLKDESDAWEDDIEDSDEDDDDTDDFHIIVPKKSPKKGSSTSLSSGSMTTKHDSTICGRKNASKMMEKFPPGFSMGDDMGMDIQLSNKIYNSLKQHSNVEEKRGQRLYEKKDQSTSEQAVDPKTRLLMYKLVNSGILESINGIISTGKEAVVFHANGGQMEEQLVPCECALKVFKTTLVEFKTREKYIKADYRFKDRFRKQNPRKVIHMWAEKEMHNLNRMRESGVRCPEVILLKKHILVMSFIGDHQKAAPKLKDVKLSTADLLIAYEQVLEMMERMFKRCNLIHADLSEYNMLWHRGEVWYIDVSQSVEPTHPHGLEFLLRDCSNVSTFFTRQGVHGVLKPHELFNQVTGLKLKPGNQNEFLAQIDAIQHSDDFDPGSQKEENFAFDYFFEKTMAEQRKSEERKEDGKEEEESEDGAAQFMSRKTRKQRQADNS